MTLLAKERSILELQVPDLNQEALAGLGGDAQALYAWLSSKLGATQRFQHSLGVCEEAVRIVSVLQLPKDLIAKAAIAGLLHDAAKLNHLQGLTAISESLGLILDPEDIASPQTIHPFVGAEMVKSELGIEDEDILNAIRYHTTARAGMSLLEKIVFIADKTEVRTRNPEYIVRVSQALIARQANNQEAVVLSNPIDRINQTVLTILDDTLRFLIARNQRIHPRTLEARNDILSRVIVTLNDKETKIESDTSRCFQ